MEKPAVPDDEVSRIEKLKSLGILDTQAEERYDRLTRLAKRIFDVPIALVSLIDENRQWFKSSVGLDATETSREISFCGHAILKDNLFVVEDAAKDPRFHDNPLVTDAPSIRFYAGFPLPNSDGSSLGTFCIIDNKPRELSLEDREALNDLANMAAAELMAVQMATNDKLTGISNRNGFELLAQKSLKFCKRQALPAALLFLDLDKFKAINDAFGHLEGDFVLQTFAKIVQQCIRDTDVIGRFGGDEFVILLSDSNESQAKLLVGRISDAISAFNQTNNKDYDINFSFGITVISPGDEITLETLFATADSAMYKDKQSDSGN